MAIQVIQPIDSQLATGPSPMQSWVSPTHLNFISLNCLIKIELIDPQPQESSIKSLGFFPSLHLSRWLLCSSWSVRNKRRIAKMAVGIDEEVVIVKPRTDNRDYKRIVLANSLEVLLISDPDTEKVTLPLYIFDPTLTFFFPIHKYIPPLLFLWLRFWILCLSVFFFSAYQQCAASMNVNVGSFCDPDGLEGLAHFLGNSVSYILFFFLGFVFLDE